MVLQHLQSLFSKKSKRRQRHPTIFDQFPELNQGQQYLQKRSKLIEPFTSNNGGSKCRYQNQASPNKKLPCTCGNSTCSESAPYCNYELGGCFNKPGNIKNWGEDWAENEKCQMAGQLSKCTNTPGCPNYGYCPPTSQSLLWDKDAGPTTFNNINSLLSDQQQLYNVYITDVNQYVANPNQSPVGRSIIVPQLTGGAPPCASCIAYDKAQAAKKAAAAAAAAQAARLAAAAAAEAAAQRRAREAPPKTATCSEADKKTMGIASTTWFLQTDNFLPCSFFRREFGPVCVNWMEEQGVERAFCT